MSLWIHWNHAIFMLRPAFSRTRSFLWFALCVTGFALRMDFLGVTSIIRALGLHHVYYDNLLKFFHSKAINLEALNILWVRSVLKLFDSHVLRVKGRIVLVGDGVKIAKQGKKMPGVKRLHQESESNTKPEYIMGHSFQSIAILVQSCSSFFAVPLTARIHEGVVYSNRDKRSLLDKFILLLKTLSLQEFFYLVADAYYASGKIIKPLLKEGNHLITRVKSNATAWEPAPPSHVKRRGRPKKYGRKMHLSKLFNATLDWNSIPSPIYGEDTIFIKYAITDALWKPAGQIVRFVLVQHPTRGSCILMATDTSLEAEEIIKLYGLRFKIEHAFKQAKHIVGTFGYHFWMMAMDPITRRGKNQYMHHQSKDYRDAIKRKLNAYHLFVSTGLIAQGLMQYLATCYPQLVWKSFGSWIRTIREGIPPSERVVAMAMRNTFPDFLLVKPDESDLAKFITDRQNPEMLGLVGLAA